jgi:DNA-binding Lrp family transcriptional regulator
LDEVVPAGSPIEGQVLDPRDLDQVMPFTSADEARSCLSDAFTLLREGSQTLSQGYDLLQIAESRQAWTILGYRSWQECLLDGVEQHLRTAIKPDTRRALSVDLRQRYGVSARDIADRLGVSHSTTNRDLAQARDSGEITNEGDTVVSKDGAKRPAKTPPRRLPLPRAFDMRADKVLTAVRYLHNMVSDDRWSEHAGRVAIKWTAEMSTSLEQLNAVVSALTEAKERESR